jgi:hypothetical protein
MVESKNSVAFHIRINSFMVLLSCPSAMARAELRVDRL